MPNVYVSQKIKTQYGTNSHQNNHDHDDDDDDEEKRRLIPHAHSSSRQQSRTPPMSLSSPVSMSVMVVLWIAIAYSHTLLFTSTLPHSAVTRVTSLILARPSSASLPPPHALSTTHCNTTAYRACVLPFEKPSLMYAYTVSVLDDYYVDGPGAVVDIQMRDTCCHVPITAPRAVFRVFSTGTAMSAVHPPIIIEPSQRSIRTFLRLPDPGTYEIHVRLMLYGVSANMIHWDVPTNGVYIPVDTDPGLWFDAAVHEFYTFRINTTIAIPSYKYKLPPTPYELLTQPLNLTGAFDRPPLCGFDRRVNGSLAGRLILGPQHEHKTYPWPSNSIYDDFNAIWSPYDCTIDYTLDLNSALAHLRWLHIIGDSNMRHLFYEICQVAGAKQYEPKKEIHYMDPPFFCVGSGIDYLGNKKQWVMTYNNWFYHKPWPLHDQLTFGEQCAKYEDIVNHQGYIGFPHCDLAEPDIKAMAGPGLTYFGWGSHAVELAVTNSTRKLFENELYNKRYFQKFPSLWALSTAVDADLIPEKFGRQQIYRNNERIAATNDLEIDVITHLLPTLPVDRPTHKNAALREGFLPILDVFSLTHSSNERLHGDAVHFWTEVQHAIIRLLTHYIRYAPQLHNEQTVKQ